MALDRVTPLRALSIRQPWAWAILHAGKDIENRPRRTNITGRILIHASAGMTKDEYASAVWDICDCREAMGRAGPVAKMPIFPNMEGLDRGGIVGSVEIVSCVADSKSPWFFGKYGYVLKNPKPLKFWPCKGQLGFFTRDWPAEFYTP